LCCACADAELATGNVPSVRRGKSLLGRDEEVGEGGLFRRTGNTLRRKHAPSPTPRADDEKSGGWFANIGPGPKDYWFIYCYLLTCCVPRFLLASCGIRTPEQQRAWREKIGLIAIIVSLMGAVGFITFGFTQTVCSKPPPRLKAGSIESGSLIVHGFAYNLTNWNHPAVSPYFDGNTSPLYAGLLPAGGMDASFLFQKPNDHCAGLLGVPSGSSIATSGSSPNWVFPCNIFNQTMSSAVNKTGYDNPRLCHTTTKSRTLLDSLASRRSVVYYSWEQVSDPARNLAVYES
jgi:chitin synthase